MAIGIGQAKTLDRIVGKPFRLCFLFLLLMGSSTLSAQDTLSKAELKEILEASRNSTFYYAWLADSLSKAGDSVNAGVAFLKTNPYCLMYEQVTPASVEAYLAEHYKLTTAARKEYSVLYTKAYNAPKSRTYNDFKKMAEEDQAIRKAMELCADSSCYSTTAAKMILTDSIHFDYLYKYFKKNGWPTLADGSMYMTLLAIHDHDHHQEYIPVLKKAVKEGKTELSALRLIVYWNKVNAWNSNLTLYLSTHKHVFFDVNSILADQFPENMPDIIQFVQQHCPVTVFFVLEAPDKQAVWTTRQLSYKGNRDLLATMFKRLAKYDCNISTDRYKAMQDGLWMTAWQKSNSEELRLKFCVVYEREGDSKFNRIITNSKYVTRAIHFDVNKFFIKPESMDFVKELAAWLRQNPTVNLEIDGHTDNDGDAAANIKLSQERADEVRNQLVALGVGAVRLTGKGFGATKPVRDNATPEGRAENRRVEFIRQ